MSHRLSSALRAEPWPVVIIGGGITGAAIARELAAAGVETLLVEGRDYGAGTSSRSTRLLHGGLRYLEQGEVRLVREALRERAEWIAQAPHLAWPLQFAVPLPARGWPRLRLRIGTQLYHRLAGRRSLGDAGTWSVAQLAAAAPLLAHAHGAATYWDAQCDDARLTLALVQDAAILGAATFNHAWATLLPGGGSGHRIALQDRLTDDPPVAITARTLIVAAGPEADDVGAHSRSGRWLSVTKGVHISVSAERLPVGAGLVLTHPADGRVCFALPAGPCTVLGTTDTATEETDPRSLAITDADTTYLLELAQYWFPSAAIAADDVWTSWAGVRPLLQSAVAPSRRSRDFVIRRDDAGAWFVLGGKLTSAQAMARAVVRELSPSLGQVQCDPALHRRPLPGGALRPEDPRGPDAPGLWRRYGSRATLVQEEYLADDIARRRLHPAHDACVGEVDYALAAEAAHRLDDVLVRRLRLADETPDGGAAAVPGIARRMAQLLGWNDAREASEADESLRMIREGRRSLM